MSSKKPFDHIEEKIKEAADNYQPAFDEMAWKAMEAKLNQGGKKRRPLLWWFVLPLLVAGSWGIYYKFNSAENIKEKPLAESNAAGAIAKDDSKNAVEKNNLQNDLITAAPVKPESISENENVSNKEEVKADMAIKKGNRSVITGSTQASISNFASSSTLVKPNKISGRKKGKVTVNSIGNAASAMDGGKAPGEDKAATSTDGVDKNVVAKNEPTVTKSETTLAEEKKAVIEDGNKEEKKQTASTGNNKKEEKPAAPKKEKAKKSKGFYVLASGGIDAGSTKLFSCQNSTATAKYGIGLGYQFNKRLSVQTGYYSNMKKYAAAPADYDIKPGSPMGLYHIDAIDATCLVYEIPLALKYDFISKPSFIVYATAGVSSYIMQKEKYDCFYTYYNTPYETEWLYQGNKHLFSTAVFSVGMEKKLFSQFSLLAEPSLSVPLTGVGDGKMNIYSLALQLGLKYYLFKKN